MKPLGCFVHTYKHTYIKSYVRTYVRTYFHTQMWMCTHTDMFRNYLLATTSGVPRVVRGVQPPSPKFLSFDKLSRIPSSVENTYVTT
jgi:hypothetical protein